MAIVQGLITQTLIYRSYPPSYSEATPATISKQTEVESQETNPLKQKKINRKKFSPEFPSYFYRYYNILSSKFVLVKFSRILINFDSGKINFNNSLLTSKKVGSLKLIESNLDFIDESLIFKGSFNFNVNDQKKFYTVFQIPKKNRKLLKNIFFDIEINSSNDKLNINNFKINDKKSIINENTMKFINQYNSKKENIILNWINLKNFTREIFSIYFG